MYFVKFIILFLLVLHKPNDVRTEEIKSFFSFVHTDKASPMDIEDSCFDIEKKSVNNMFLGISLFIHKSTTCKPGNIELKEIKKSVIHVKHERQLCRTKLTVSINRKNCEKEIEKLKYICTHLDENSTIFFQHCMDDSDLEKYETTTGEIGDIIISAFPTPTMGALGNTYEIPRAHCNMKKCEVKRCLANKAIEMSTLLSTDSDARSTQIVFIPSIVTGCVGLLVGVFSTSFVCVCIHRHNKNRKINDGLVSKFNTYRKRGTERIRSNHSKEKDIVYHDILDIQDTANSKLKRVSTDFNHYDSPEQRYSESPKSSTSTYENDMETSQLSINESIKSPKECRLRNDQSGMYLYHNISKDSSLSSTNSVDEDLFKSETLVFDDNMAFKAMDSLKQTEYVGESASYEEPTSIQSNSKNFCDIYSDASTMSAVNSDTEDPRSPFYYVLQEK